MLNAFNVLFYGPHLPLSGIATQAYFTEYDLRVENQHIGLERLESSLGGFNHDDLFLIWEDANGERWAVQPATQDDILIVEKTAPVFLKPQMKKWHSRKRGIHFVWWTLGSLTATVVLSVTLLWVYSDETVGWIANKISTERELALGESLLEQIKASDDIVESGLAVKTVSEIGNKLTKDSRYHYQWFIKKDKTMNAFALPGGIVIVHSGLIAKSANADELAGVLAHEVQHIEQRHTLKSMIKSLGWATALMVVLGDVNTATAVIIHQVGNMYFSRDLESEADRLGFQALLKARIEPQSMVTMFEKLDKQPNANLPEWISTHPETKQRIKAIQQLIKDQPCPECKALLFDWKKVQSDKALAA